MAERTPVRETYDVHLGLDGSEGLDGLEGYAIVKQTFAFDPRSGSLAYAPALPLINNLEDPNLDPKLPAHSDFWPGKRLTDIGIIGSAYAKDANPTRKMVVGAEITGRRRALLVHGKRSLSVRQGRAVIGDAEPFDVVPLDISGAYGGLDGRVPIDTDDQDQVEMVATQTDWPGLYPRNPWGVGYLCTHDDVEDLAMPTQEDFYNPLSPENLIVDPARWYLQPLPAHLGWTPVNCFPRNMFLAIECMPWFRPPDDGSLPEVAIGVLPPGWSEMLKSQNFGCPPHWRFRQESGPGFTFKPEALPGAEIRVIGMHPSYPELRLKLPLPPSLEMKFESVREPVEAALASVEIRPDEERLTMTYASRIKAPRPFLPGVHAEIPLGISVNGDPAVFYQPPVPIKHAMRDAKAKRAKEAS